MIIEVSPDDAERLEAIVRKRVAYYAAFTNRVTASTTYEHGIRVGVWGEYAVGKWLGLPVADGTPDPGYDFEYGGIRIDVKGSESRIRRLMMPAHQRHKLGRSDVLVLAEPSIKSGQITIIGWIHTPEFQERHREGDRPEFHFPTWWLPADELSPPDVFSRYTSPGGGMNDPILNGLVIGPSGHGKSWLASTTPPPRLIIDLEGRAKYTPNGRSATEWDGVSDPMKLAKSPTRTYILRAQSVAQLDTTRQWLRSGRHPFKSISIDSLMEAQIRVAEQIRPGIQSMRRQDFGDLLRHMQVFTREIRDLTDVPETNVRCTLFVAGAKRDEDGFIRPMMQGQIARAMPYWMDVCGYLEKIRTDKNKIVRRLWLEQRPECDLEVKDGTDFISVKYGSPIAMSMDRETLVTIEDLYNTLPKAESAA